MVYNKLLKNIEVCLLKTALKLKISNRSRIRFEKSLKKRSFSYVGEGNYLERISAATSPTESEWDDLVLSGGIIALDPVVDVIVPVYRGFAETMRCLFSVISAVQQTPYRLLVINDASPDQALVKSLRELADRGWIELIENDSNLGFVLSCNRGMRVNKYRDVILLNSDTEVYSDWLDRLMVRAGRDTHIGSMTPFSNNATICSYPHFLEDNFQALEISCREIDSVVSRVLAHYKTVSIPTAVGFCMYVRRLALNDVGLFDEQNFGKGYGEENDLSLRLSRAGWSNVLVPNVYIKHWGAVSFAGSADNRKKKAQRVLEKIHPNHAKNVSSFIASDPLRPLREQIDIERLKLRARNGAMLVVTHDFGGGTETHVQHMRKWIESKSNLCVFICRPHPTSANLFYIDDLKCGPIPNIAPRSWMDGSSSLEGFFSSLNITQIHVHHLLRHHSTAPRTLRELAKGGLIKVFFTVHDYFSICPRVNLIDQSGTYCGEPDSVSCQNCIEKNGSKANGNVDIIKWRQDHLGLIEAAQAVYVPNADVRVRLANYTDRNDILVREHETDPILISALRKPLEIRTRNNLIRKVAVIGAIGPHKGADVLYRTAKAALMLGLQIEFVVIGFTSIDKKLKSLKNVNLTGAYDPDKVLELISNVNPDLAWFPSVCPETFCFTLSEAIFAGVQPIAFDIGAQADRIRQIGWGAIMPINLMHDPSAAAHFLATAVVTPPMERMRKSAVRLYPSFSAYYSAD